MNGSDSSGMTTCPLCANVHVSTQKRCPRCHAHPSLAGSLKSQFKLGVLRLAVGVIAITIAALVILVIMAFFNAGSDVADSPLFFLKAVTAIIILMALTIVFNHTATQIKRQQASER